MDDKYPISLKEGSTEAFAALIDQYGSYVAKILQSFLGSGLSKEDLEEITSDVFFTLWKKRNELSASGNIKGYIAVVSRNIGRKRLKKLKFVEPLPDDFDMASDDLTPSDVMERSEETRMVLSLINTLNKEDKEIFIRYYYLEQSTGEISKLMQINKSTIMSRLARGRKGMKMRIGGIQNGY